MAKILYEIRLLLYMKIEMTIIYRHYIAFKIWLLTSISNCILLFVRKTEATFQLYLFKASSRGSIFVNLPSPVP